MLYVTLINLQGEPRRVASIGAPDVHTIPGVGLNSRGVQRRSQVHFCAGQTAAESSEEEGTGGHLEDIWTGDVAVRGQDSGISAGAGHHHNAADPLAGCTPACMGDLGSGESCFLPFTRAPSSLKGLGSG